MSMNLRSRSATKSPPSPAASPSTRRRRSVSRTRTIATSSSMGILAVKADPVVVSSAAQAAPETLSAARCGHLLPFHEVPDHLKELHIFHGYRKPGLTVKECVHSIFSWHNETMNVWTHMLGFIFFLFLFFYCALYMSPVSGFIPHHPSNGTHSFEGNYTTPSIPTMRHPLLELAVHKIHDALSIIDDIEKALHRLESNIEKKMEPMTHKLHEMEHKLEEKLEPLKKTMQSLVSHLPSVSGLSTKADEIVTEIENAIDRTVEGTPAAPVLRFAAEMLHEMKEYLVPKHISRWPVFLYIACAMICLLNSTLYHLFGTHSFRAYKFFARCDYSGIALLIAGSCFPAVYYGFYCSSMWKWVYLSLMCAIGGGVITLCNIEWFYEPKYRIFRAVMFVAMGCVGVVPALHMLFHVGADVVVPFLMYMAAMGLCYLSGVTIYACRIPERYAPGKFDLVGHSHQLFHILVVVAAYIHFLGCVHIHETLTMYSCNAFL